jgi:hypothetical protein
MRRGPRSGKSPDAIGAHGVGRALMPINARKAISGKNKVEKTETV